MNVLEGIRVLDWTVLQQGAVCASLLGDLGADVIKIEAPDIGDMGRYFDNFFGIKSALPQGSTYYFEVCNRNKRGMTLNLKSEKGREIFYRLVESCDVLVQNFRVGVAEKLGLDYDTLKKINPRLIYTHATGMGAEGPEAHTPLIDPGALARSGLMWSVGEEGGTEPLPVQAPVRPERRHFCRIRYAGGPAGPGKNGQRSAGHILAPGRHHRSELDQYLHRRLVGKGPAPL